MSTYIVPIYNEDENDVYIEKVSARNLEEAEDRIMNKYLDAEDEVPCDYSDFLDIIYQNQGLVFGSFYELSEF